MRLFRGLPGVCGVVATLALEATAVASAASLDDLVAWYQLPDGQEVLLTWAADGDLRLATLGEPFFSRPFQPKIDGSFLWLTGSDGKEETRTVHFRFAADGTPIGFEWPAADAGSAYAPRLDSQPYRLREFAFDNQLVSLSGTLLIPTRRLPVPAAVMIHGSGESDRDNLWYLEIADHLARNGIAVLLPDKRGCGKSGGEWRTAGMEDFAGDSRAAAEAVRGQSGIDPARVGFVGVSQGGSIAPLAATMTADSAFAVSLVAGVTTFDEILLHESRQTLRQNGLPGLLADALAPMAAAIARRRRPVWWNKNGGFDPLPYWRQLTIPKLFIYGGQDERDNVPVSQSVARLEDAELSQLKIEIYPDSGHGLFLPGTKTIRPDFLELLSTWIQQNSGESLGDESELDRLENRVNLSPSICVCAKVTRGGHVARPKGAVSQHLAKLRAYGLTTSRRDAQTIYYRLTGHAFLEKLRPNFFEAIEWDLIEAG